jgi:hypothetical protein
MLQDMRIDEGVKLPAPEKLEIRRFQILDPALVQVLARYRTFSLRKCNAANCFNFFFLSKPSSIVSRPTPDVEYVANVLG